MSFKRDGDDKSLLGTLRKRRVDELFAENIPEDEAFLMSSGRFACTVCNHRPVFDTINMLAIHRSGKKHLASIEYHKARKRETEELVWKRRHEMFLKNGSTDIAMSSSSKGGLLTASPYDARVKRPKVKPYDRKVRLCLDSQTPEATPANSLPGYSKTLYTASGPMTHSYKLRDIFREKSSDTGTMNKPYLKKGQSAALTNEPNTSKHTESMRYKQNSTSTSQANAQTSCYPTDYLSLLTLLPPPPPPPPPPETVCAVPSPSNCGMQQVKQKGSSKSCKKKISTESECKQRSAEERQRAEEYLKLTEAGWKKDRGGNWVKDEDVEFDSDEDAPNM